MNELLRYSVEGEVLRPVTRYEVSSLIQSATNFHGTNSLPPAAAIVIRKLKLQRVRKFASRTVNNINTE
jgi:hypothetical protein